MSNYTVHDRRGQSPAREACRVCGAGVVHSREYGKPTMECIQFLNGTITLLQESYDLTTDERDSLRADKERLDKLQLVCAADSDEPDKFDLRREIDTDPEFAAMVAAAMTARAERKEQE